MVGRHRRKNGLGDRMRKGEKGGAEIHFGIIWPEDLASKTKRNCGGMNYIGRETTAILVAFSSKLLDHFLVFILTIVRVTDYREPGKGL